MHCSLYRIAVFSAKHSLSSQCGRLLSVSFESPSSHLQVNLIPPTMLLQWLLNKIGHDNFFFQTGIAHRVRVGSCWHATLTAVDRTSNMWRASCVMLCITLMFMRSAEGVESGQVAAATAGSKPWGVPDLFADPPSDAILPASAVMVRNKPTTGTVATMSAPGGGEPRQKWEGFREQALQVPSSCITAVLLLLLGKACRQHASTKQLVLGNLHSA